MTRNARFLSMLLPLVACTGGTDSKPADTADTSDTDTAAPEQERGCLAVDPSEACPDPTTVLPDDVIPQTCGATVISVDGPGTAETCGWIGGFAAGWCTYPITIIPPEEPCDYGRPLLDEAGHPRVAALVRRGFAPAAAVSPDPARAEQWSRIALAEHASVASFSRFALQLLALGAPADLIDDAHAAARDEVRHAQLAFGLASGFAGVPLGPGPLPATAAPVPLLELAVATAREGCVAETLSALKVEAALELEADPIVRAVLTTIAEDERRHAALAWRTLRWAIDAGGAEVRAAVAAVFATAPGAGGGLVEPAVAAEVVASAWAEVITPAAAALTQ